MSSKANQFVCKLNHRGLCSQSDATMQIFEKAKPMIDDEMKKKINGTILFQVSGRNYFFKAQEAEPLTIEKVDEAPKADVTMITEEETFLKIATGKTKPAVAFMSGKLKIRGNIELAMRAEVMFKAIQNKGDE
uniref:Hydroxysteroid dehydrogenase-like protein 2 n=2 Tax=Sarcoptes scabiei TaxID=52283 RepID=A0A834RFB5_SARSC